MESKVEERSDYESDVCNDPIELLQATRECSTNNEESRHDVRIIVDALDSHMNCKQRDNESL